MRTIQGTVVSTKMDKTIVVAVVTEKSHPKYQKKFKTTKKFYAHDEKGAAQEGDIVTIIETKPLSKLKRWTVVEEKSSLKEDSSVTETKTAAKKTTKKAAVTNEDK